MSPNTAPKDIKLTVDGVEHPIHVVEWDGRRHDGRVHYTARGSIHVDELARRDLIDFAKTGAPPAWGPAEIETALRDREAAFDESSLPPGTTPLPPRELYGDRMVPRMQKQKPWSSVEAAKNEKHPTIVWAHPGETIITNLRCDRHGSYTGSPGNIACPHCPLPRPESLNDFAKQVHQDNQHWWHDPATGEKLNRNMCEMLMLVVSEIAECMEGERKDLMDDHLPHRKMAEVELADAVIRLADIMGSMIGTGTFPLSAEWKLPGDRTPPNKGQALLRICRKVVNVSVQHSPRTKLYKMAYALAEIEQYATTHGYDLWGAVAEKREYNKHRADHKPEARLAAGGKKF